MKRITNILSYLCLLLLLPVVACSDLEEIVVNMQGEEEVELTIQTNIPSLGGSTRTAPTENITSITALAFDSDHELIKVAIEDVTISPDPTPSTSGTYTVKVPVRTRRIHFIAKNDDNPNDETDVEFTEITDDDYGKSDEELLKDRLTTELHYWGKLDFEDAEDLKSGRDVTLYRNMAKLNLQTGGENDYIAGLIHYNSKGTIAPYITTNSDDEAINDFGYQDGISHYIPKDDNGVSFITTDASDKNYGKVHYLFEESNKKSDGFGEESDIVYVICNIGTKFYKVAFKPTSSSEDFYHIVRNKQYTIKIKDGATLGDTYAAEDYESALDLAPINNTDEVDIEILEEMDVYMFVDETGTATLNIPAGMTQLEIGYSQDNFAQGGVNVTNIAPNSKSELEVTSENENGQSETIRLWIDAYKESLPEEQTTWTLNIQLKEEYIDEVKGSGDPSILQIQFLGEGTGMKLNQKLNVHIMLRGTLGVTSAVSLPNKVGSEFTQIVNIPDFGGYDENFKLKVDDVDSKYTITAPQGLQLVEDANGNYYEVEEDSQYTFTFALKAVGEVGQKHTINFTATSEYHELTGTTTVTLIDDAVPDQDVYEIWVGDGNDWTGTINSVEFFGYNKATPEGSFAAGTTPDGFRKDFYDTGANAHISQEAMLMGSDDSFTFTIPEGDSRWLTLLVANDGDDSDTPSIQLSNGSDWTTAGNTVDLTNGTYNFGAEGEITSAGRLIRYELEPGTYTLQRGTADYLLYYMRVSKARPEMTDVAQPLLADYNLSWSGGDYANTEGKGYLKISDDKHIVDEDNLTHTVSLNADNSLSLNTSLNLTSDLSTFDLTVATTRVTFTNENENTYNGDKSVTKDYNNQTNSCSLTTYNAGNYTLKGTINSPVYKYSAFYDKLLLDAVQYEVKSPIMPGLYNSMDGSVLTPVEGFTSMDAAWAIGFKMPMVVPISASELLPYDANNPKYKNYTIDINILNWTLSTDGDARGLGVIENSTGNYKLGTQENANGDTMIHPREGWTYKIKWASIAGESITPKLTDEEDPDHYFTYKGTIAKEVTIPTPYTETTLNITLDFYADEDGDGINENQGNSFNNLLLKLTDQTVASKVGLKATVTGDISTYDGKTVVLTGDFPSYNASNSGWAIHWVNSRKNGDIYYYGQDQNGTGLQFTIDANKQEQTYFIEWEFVPSTNNYPGGDIGFTYKISAYADSPVKYNLSGDTQATIAFTNEPTSNGQIQVAANGSAASNSITMPLEYGANSTEEFTVDVTVPAGVTQINIEAEDFDIAWGDMDNSNTNISSHTFSSSSDSQTTRFKFTLKDSSNTENSSTITFSDNSGSAASATSATITVDLSPRTSEPSGGTTIWNGMMDLSWDYALNYLSVKDQIPTGSVVTLNFTTTTGGAFKLHDVDGGADAIVLPNISYGENPGVISVNAGQTSYSFTVTNDIIVNNQNISEYIDGLKINGDNVRMTSIVVKYPVIYCNFDNDIEGFYVSGKGSVERVDNALALISDYNETDEPWAAQAMKTTDKIEYRATYTLTFKAKIEYGTTGEMAVAIQRFENGECVATDHYRIFTINDINNAEKDNQDWAEFTYDITIQDNNQETPNENNPTHFMFNFGDINGTVYIDDLKLVEKTN